jgi:hypothetical protein
MYAEADLDEWAAGLIGSPVRRASETADTARAA